MTRSETTEHINRHIDSWLYSRPNTVSYREVGLLTAVPIKNRRVLWEDKENHSWYSRRADFLAWENWPGIGDTWIIIEVKSCIADYWSDQKWRHYLKFCNRFYFAVMDGFPIEKIERSPDVGIISVPAADATAGNARIVRRVKSSPVDERVDMERMKFLMAWKKPGSTSGEILT